MSEVDAFDLEPLDDLIPTAAYTHIMLTIAERAPLLARPRLARCVVRALDSCADDAPGQLWGYVVLPECVRLIVGPAADDAVERFVGQIKQHSRKRLLDIILRANDDSLDTVLRYNPVRGGPIYRVWEAGSHRLVFWTEYRLSNALYDLLQAPVEAELVAEAGDWPYTWIGGNEES